MVTVVMTLAFTGSTVEAAQKAYPAQKNSKLYGMYLDSAIYTNTVKNGVLNVVNADELSIYAKNDKIMYYEKANGADVAKVKTPTKYSKKLSSAEFVIAKDTTFKFKVVKKNATAKQIKKAKTYYVIIKVKKDTNFFTQEPKTLLDKGEELTYKCNKEIIDGAQVYFDGKRTFSLAPTKDNTKVKMVFYKYGKKVGTKSFTVTWKKYTNKVTNPYRLPETSVVNAISTESTDPELEMEVSCKGLDVTKGEDALRIGKLVKTVVTVKQYQKVYYKENGKLVQCGRKLYSTETKKYNAGLAKTPGEIPEAFAGTCPTEEKEPGITAMRITYVNTDGYLVSEVVAPGEHIKGEMMYGAFFEFQYAGEWLFTTDRARCEAFAREDSDHWGVNNFMRTLKGEKIKLY